MHALSQKKTTCGCFQHSTCGSLVWVLWRILPSCLVELSLCSPCIWAFPRGSTTLLNWNRDAQAVEYTHVNPLHERIWSHLVFMVFVFRVKIALLGQFSPTSARRREREKRKRRFCDQCCRVNVKDKSTEQCLESLSSDSQRLLFWWTRSPRRPGTKSSTSCSWCKFNSRWRSRIWSEEIQNMRWLSRDESLNLKNYNRWKPINGQIKLSVREYTCVVNWWWRAVFTRNATQEVAKKWKNWEDAAFKK